MPDSDLKAACDELIDRIAFLETLMHQPDDDGSTAKPAGKPVSRPPWNSEVAGVLMDSHETARRLEAALRYALTSHPGARRGGSTVNTIAALSVLSNLAAGLGVDAERLAAVIVSRLLTAAKQLPAIDEAPKWRALRPGPDGLAPKCPYCETYNLRVAVRSRVVMCFYPPCPGDGIEPGTRPQAVMDIGAQSGQPMLVWRDGGIQIPDRVAA